MKPSAEVLTQGIVGPRSHLSPRELAKFIMNVYQDDPPYEDEHRKGLENAARGALAAVTGKSPTDESWERARARLLQFVSILRTWQRAADVEQLRAAEVSRMRKKPTGDFQLDKAA